MKHALGSNKGRAFAGAVWSLGFTQNLINDTICPSWKDKYTQWDRDNYWIVVLPDCSNAVSLRMPYGWNFFKASGGITQEFIMGHQNGVNLPGEGYLGRHLPVSYTHLTLPTILLV